MWEVKVGNASDLRMAATLALTALASEPWSRVVLLALSGRKRPTRC